MTLDRDAYLHDITGWPDDSLLAKLDKSARIGVGELSSRVGATLAVALVWVIAGLFWLGTTDGRTGVAESLSLSFLAVLLVVGFGMAFLRDRTSRQRYLALIAEPTAFDIRGGTVVAIFRTTMEVGSSETIRKIRWRLDDGQVEWVARIRISQHDPELWVGQPLAAAIVAEWPYGKPLLLCRRRAVRPPLQPLTTSQRSKIQGIYGLCRSGQSSRTRR